MNGNGWVCLQRVRDRYSDQLAYMPVPSPSLSLGDVARFPFS